jgi:hypothetical protein
MIEQPNAGAANFHILFVDGRLFELLAKNESLYWQAVIKGYIRFCGWKSGTDHLWRQVCSRFSSVYPLVRAFSIVTKKSVICRRPSHKARNGGIVRQGPQIGALGRKEIYADITAVKYILLCRQGDALM